MTDDLDVTFIGGGPVGRSGDQVIFVVNGRDIRDLAPQDDAGWVGPWVGLLNQHPDHLLGGPDRWEDADDPWYEDPALLACGCGAPGCGAVLVHIEVGETAVHWTRFRSGHADELRDLQVGPFEFERSKYDSVLREIATHA
jgi:hypothetical protein